MTHSSADLRLTLRHHDEVRIGGVVVRVLERLGLSVAVIKREPPNRVLDCLVDTGSPLPFLVPHARWEHFPDDIEWVSAEEQVTLPRALREVTGAAGGVLRFRWGFI